MSQVQNMCMARSTLDQRPSLPFCPRTNSLDGYPTTRRSSLARSTSSASSPDSMISDVSTLSSQSSISNPPVLPRLAIQATMRSTNNSIKENRKPLTIASPIDEATFSDIYNSPETYGGPVPDLSSFSLGTPVDMTSAHEAAQSLCALSGAAPKSQEQRPCRKRGRTNSEDLTLQRHVRELVRDNAFNEGMVLSDGHRADWFRRPQPLRTQTLTAAQLQALNHAALSGPAGMKRACCGSEARKVALNPSVRAEYLG